MDDLVTSARGRERRFTYRVYWAVLVAVSLRWGVLVGEGLSGSGILGPATTVTGTYVLLVLAATLFVADRAEHSS